MGSRHQRIVTSVMISHFRRRMHQDKSSAGVRGGPHQNKKTRPAIGSGVFAPRRDTGARSILAPAGRKEPKGSAISTVSGKTGLLVVTSRTLRQGRHCVLRSFRNGGFASSQPWGRAVTVRSSPAGPHGRPPRRPCSRRALEAAQGLASTQCRGDPPKPCMLLSSMCVPDRAVVSESSASDLR